MERRGAAAGVGSEGSSAVSIYEIKWDNASGKSPLAPGQKTSWTGVSARASNHLTYLLFKLGGVWTLIKGL